MFVLGVDPGLTRCGFGLLDAENGGSPRAVAAGVLETSPGRATEDRLTDLARDLSALYEQYRPDVVVVEKVFFQRNARTAVPVTQLSGIAIALAGLRGAHVRQFTSQEMKLAVCGYGAATKEQIQQMVTRLLHLREVPRPPDAADALGLALTYLRVAPREERWAEALP
ncbi:MAG: crossover junction endodeoxyribonuclease RuvC [Acidobacteria bacterium]|nr:crossover junction endodeoxyribonuclease RuvC [Acidobacteriota bacterium]